MRRNITKITHFILQNTQDGKTMGKVFITKPSIEKEKKYGRIFGFVMFETPDSVNDEFMSLVIEEVKNSFYNEKTPIHFQKKDGEEISDIMTNNLERQFEVSLKKTNQKIARMLERPGLTMQLEHITIVVSAIKDTNIVFSTIGKVDALLTQHLKNNSYRITNISEGSKNASLKIHPLNFFSQTLSGKVNNYDTIFFSSSNVLDYLSLEQIKNSITQYQAQEGVAEIKKMLKKTENINTFFGIMASSESVEQNNDIKTIESIKNFNYEKAANEDSMGSLVMTEKKTEKLLMSSTSLSFKKLSSLLQKSVAQFRQRMQEFSTKKKAIPSKASSSLSSKTLPDRKNNLFLIPIQLILSIQKSRIVQRIMTTIKKMFGDANRWFWALPKKNKIIFVLTSIIAILFLITTLRLIFQKKTESNETTFLNTISLIEQKKDAATAALIYSDRNTAHKALTEAQVLINNLPDDYKNHERVESLKKSIDEEVAELRSIENLSEPIMLANFKNLNENLQIAPFLIKYKNTLYSQSYDNNSLYTYDLNTRLIASLKPSSDDLHPFAKAAVWNENIFFLSENNEFFNFSITDSKLTKIAITLPNNTEITSFQIFNDQLYILDAKSNKITRFRMSKNSFTNSTNWINDNSVDISTAVDFAIDGDIYVLLKNGDVVKLTRGIKSKVFSGIIEPKLITPKRIITNADSQTMYILDPDSKRIISFSKSGQISKQYFSENFQSLRDFVVSEQDKKIYTLDDTSIIGIPTE